MGMDLAPAPPGSPKGIFSFASCAVNQGREKLGVSSGSGVGPRDLACCPSANSNQNDAAFASVNSRSAFLRLPRTLKRMNDSAGYE